MYDEVEEEEEEEEGERHGPWPRDSLVLELVLIFLLFGEFFPM